MRQEHSLSLLCQNPIALIRCLSINQIIEILCYFNLVHIVSYRPMPFFLKKGDQELMSEKSKGQPYKPMLVQ